MLMRSWRLRLQDNRKNGEKIREKTYPDPDDLLNSSCTPTPSSSDTLQKTTPEATSSDASDKKNEGFTLTPLPAVIVSSQVTPAIEFHNQTLDTEDVTLIPGLDTPAIIPYFNPPTEVSMKIMSKTLGI